MASLFVVSMLFPQRDCLRHMSIWVYEIIAAMRLTAVGGWLVEFYYI